MELGAAITVILASQYGLPVVSLDFPDVPHRIVLTLNLPARLCMPSTNTIHSQQQCALLALQSVSVYATVISKPSIGKRQDGFSSAGFLQSQS